VKCVIEHGGKWLMIRNTYGRGHWTLPGGRIERHEAPADAARREVREEVGIHLPSVEAIGDYFNASEYKRDTVYCFRATVPTPEHEIDGKEIAEARWFDPHAVPEFHSRAVDRIKAML
jgi:8-oxo-dGTP pyrophosphatase MutT (NUDIX family)